MTLNRRTHLLIGLIGAVAVTLGAAALRKGIEANLAKTCPTIDEAPLPPRARLDESLVFFPGSKTDAVQPVVTTIPAAAP